MQWFQGRLVLKARERLYHTTPDFREIKKKKKKKKKGAGLKGLSP